MSTETRVPAEQQAFSFLGRYIGELVAAFDERFDIGGYRQERRGVVRKKLRITYGDNLSGNPLKRGKLFREECSIKVNEDNVLGNILIKQIRRDTDALITNVNQYVGKMFGKDEEDDY